RNTSHVANWFDCIRSRSTPICDVEVGARTATLTQLVNMTYRLGRPLKWDWRTWTFDDAEANALRDYDRRGAYALPSG
ncbi:MAG: hypothetical protein KDA28_11460, partial [Phycisphaerales bacterium]|nr:hypothetical protein [Phycisphaerales bacterium]